MKFLRYYIASLILSVATHGAFAASAPGAAKDVELLRALYSMTVFSRTVNDHPVASPDGRWFAYSVQKEGERAVGTAQGEDSVLHRYLVWRPQLIIRDLASGRVVAVAPDAAASWLPAWSPDSLMVAFYASDHEHEPRLWVYDLASGKARRVADVPIQKGLNDLARPQWSPDGNTIMVSATPTASTPRLRQDMTFRELGPSHAPITAGARVSVWGSGSEVLPRDKDRPAGQDDYIVTAPADLVSIDVATGKVAAIVGSNADPVPCTGELSPCGRWLAYLSPAASMTGKFRGLYDPEKTSALVADFAITPASGGKPIVVEREVDYPGYATRDVPRWLSRDRFVYTRAGRLFLVTIDDRGAHTIPLAHDAARAIFVSETADGNALLVGNQPKAVDGSSGSVVTSLVWIPLDGKSPHILPMDDRSAFRSVFASRYRNILWQPNPGMVTFVGTDIAAQQDVARRWNVQTGAIEELWRGRGQLDPIDVIPHLNRMVVRFEDPETAPDLWTFTAGGRRDERLTELNPGLKDVKVGEIAYLSTTVPGWEGEREPVRFAVILPPGAKRGDRLPAIVAMYPGRPMFASASSFGGGREAGPWAAALLRRGYAVVYASLPTRPNRTVGNRAQEATDVLLAQVYNAATLGYIDGDRVALFGWSQAGYTAAAVATQTNLFRAIVAGGAAYDLPGFYSFMGDSDTVANRWPERGLSVGGPPWDNLPRYLANSPYYQVERIHTPLLLLVGDRDAEGRPLEHLKMFAALQTYNKPVQLAVYHGEGHGLFFGTTTNTIDVSLRMMAFLDRYLQPGRSAN